MQSKLIQPVRFAPRRWLASLTLCAVAAPSLPAFAQSAPENATAYDGETAGEGFDARSQERETPLPGERLALASGDTPLADQGRGAIAYDAASTLPFSTRFAFTGTRPEAFALTLPRLSLQAAAPVDAPARPAGTPAPAAPPPDATQAASGDDGAGLRTAGYVAGGVGIVGLALFAVAGLAAKSTYDKLESECGTTACTDDAHQSDIEEGRMMQTMANIGLATGLTGLGVSATLLVLGNRSLEKRMPAASLSPNGGMITYGGHF